MTIKGRQINPLVLLLLFTSMMLPRFEDTIFWKDLLSRFSFPLELFTNVVTSFLMASSMSGNAETRKKTRKELEWGKAQAKGRGTHAGANHTVSLGILLHFLDTNGKNENP